MIDKTVICHKIQEIYPDIGRCGIDIEAEFNPKQNRWVVDLKRDHRHLKTYLEEGDAELCMMGRQCVGLSIEIAQLKGNLERGAISA